jgi:hypothetical protein
MRAPLRFPTATGPPPRFPGAVFALLAGACACGTTRGPSSEPGVQNAGGMAGGSSPVLDVDASAAGAQQASCAPDLQSVVDGNGAVVKQCPSDQGCAGGACVAACDAAAQSHGSIGCEFWGLDPPFYGNGRMAVVQSGPCYAVFLANAWSRSAQISVSRAGRSLDVTSFARIPRGTGPGLQYESLPATGLPPNEVAVLFLSHKPGTVNLDHSLECPVAPAVLEDDAIEGSGRGSAFHVVSDTPLSAYDILPYGGASSYLPSATLLLPAAAWGTNYIALGPRGDGYGELWATLVAQEDGTTVQVAPLQSLPGSSSLAPAPAGQVTTYNMDAGEAVQWIDIASRPQIDPSGTVFASNKPIGLWTGDTLLYITSATSPLGGFRDSAHQQMAPISALGSEYVGPGIVSRLPSLQPESLPYRLMGVVDGTNLSWDPLPAATAPLQLDAGQIAEFETTELFSVRSQDADHPFAFTQYMPGSPRPSRNTDCMGFPPTSAQCSIGDEDWVSLVPAQQFLQRYVFFTDPSYATTNLVVVRRSGDSGFADVQLECLGTITGWLPVGSAGIFEVAYVDLVRQNVPVQNCATSQHIATSARPFGVVVWGTDAAASYGYPAGGNFAPLNSVIVPPVVR